MKSYDRFSASQINRQFVDALGLKNISVKKFKERILPNIPYDMEIRGNRYMKSQQRCTKVYSIEDIVNYIRSESQRIKVKREMSLCI